MKTKSHQSTSSAPMQLDPTILGVQAAANNFNSMLSAATRYMQENTPAPVFSS
jgi:hypothetical protein